MFLKPALYTVFDTALTVFATGDFGDIGRPGSLFGFRF